MPRLVPALGGAVVVVLVAVLALNLAPLLGRGGPPTTPPTFRPTTSPSSLPASSSAWSRLSLPGPATSRISNIAVGPRGVVAVARPDFDDGSGRVFFSADGRDWAAADVPTPLGVYIGLAASERGFLMTVSEHGAFASEDGLAWRRVADDWGGNPDVGGAIVVSVVGGGPGYVSIGNHNSIWSSTDGAEWTRASVPGVPAELSGPGYPAMSADIYQVAGVGGHLVATGSWFTENGEPGFGRDFTLASSDGVTWSSVLTDAGDRAGLPVAAGPGGFLIIGGHPDGERESTIWQSTDGQTWQAIATYDFSSGSGHEVRIEGLAAGVAGYAVVGFQRDCMNCAMQARIWTSPDGRTWSQMAPGNPFNLDEPGTTLASVAAFGTSFLIGGEQGGLPAIWIPGSAPR